MVPRRGVGSPDSSSWILRDFYQANPDAPGRSPGGSPRGVGPVTARPLSPPRPLMTLVTTRPPGRRRSESPEFPPTTSPSRSPPAAAPVSVTRRRRRIGGAVTTRQAARRLAPVRNPQSPATLQRPGRRSTRRQDFPKHNGGNVEAVSVTTVFVIFPVPKLHLLD